MGHVLILDPDATHAAELTHELRTVSSCTEVCSQSQEVIDIVNRRQIDVVILVSDSSSDWKRSAELLRDTVNPLPNPPQIVCVLRGEYRGPGDRLYGARRGIKVIYEKQ